MVFDLDRIRRETPGCATGTVYLNAAGAALMPDAVIDAMTAYLHEEARFGGYEAAERHASRLDRLYDAAAELLHCRPHEIAVTESATRAWDMAFYSIPLAAGDRILTGATEYGSNYLAMLQAVRRSGAVIDVIPNDEWGAISVDALRAAMNDRVKLIAITHVPSNGGLVSPAAAIGEIAAAWGVPYLLDACQSVGQMDVDVARIGCTMLAATSRKFLRGPRGAGLLYVRGDFIERLEPPFIDVRSAQTGGLATYDLRADARRFEAWESSHVTRCGLLAAIEYALRLTLPAIERRVSAHAQRLRQLLGAIPRVTVRDQGRERCGIVTFTIDGIDSAAVRSTLAAGAITTGLSTEAAAPLDMDHRGLTSMVRASPHYYNDDRDLERLAAAVATIAEP